MSVPNPLLTEGGFELETESGQILLTESDQTFASAQPYAALITSEHNQKPKFMNLVQTLCAGLGDVTALLQSIPQAFNLNGGAMGAQLDILGQWIGQSRIIPSILVPGFFGFSELSTGLPDGLQLSFGELTNASIGGIWYDFGAPYSGTTTLNDSQYAVILNARIVRNQSPGTMAAIETSLYDIFGVPCQIIDTSNFKLQLVVAAPASSGDQALINQMDILPRPAGVAISSILYLPSGGPAAVTPVFLPPSGTYHGGVVKNVTIQCATPGAAIYFSNSGTPTYPPQHGTYLYTGPFNLAALGTTTFEAIAVAAGYAISGIGSVTYTVTL